MKAIRVRAFGGPEQLEQVTLPIPEPGDGEILVRVAATGVNFADLRMREGAFAATMSAPFVPGFEVSGHVEAVGPGAAARALDPRAIAIGAPVLAADASSAYAEYVVVPADMAIPLPADADLVEAAALPVAHGVAWMALHDRGCLRPHETVLIHSAAGGVGLAATQLATAAGATVVALASSTAKLDATRKAGAQLALSYLPEYPLEQVRAQLGGSTPIDLVLDSVGGPALVDALSLLRFGGRAVCFGQAGGVPTDLHLYASVIPRQLELRGLARGALVKSADPLQRGKVINAVSRVVELWSSGSVSPAPIETLPLAEAAAAHRALADRSHVGKFVLTCE